jgi:histidine triad (HIT) family protein
MMPSAVRGLLLKLYGKARMKMSGCLFCQIIAHEKPAVLIYEDERCVAIEDVYPKAPLHALVIPRKHLATLADCAEEDEELLGHLLHVAAQVAKDKGVPGFRTVINTNSEAGQTIYHLHIHVLGGRTMRWPPG